MTFIMLSAFFLFAITTQAARHRVNNQGMGAQFSTINAAIGAASAGDTIYVEGSPVSYNGFSASKKVIIIGPGYFLANNPETQANLYSATVSNSTFNNGSSGSVVMGLKFYTGGFYTCLDVNDDSITVKRNSFYLSSTHSDNQPALRVYSSKTIISQNYIERVGNGYALKIESNNCTGIIINNNYICHVSGGTAFSNPASTSINFTHNVLSGSVSVNNANVFNNIMISGSFGHTNSVVNNNICNGTQFPVTGNLQNVDMNLVFDLTDPSPDGKYRLIDDITNPAIGYGALSADCGMFGGSDPYKLSGIPAVPAIYFFYAPVSGSANSNLPSNIKIKSHD